MNKGRSVLPGAWVITGAICLGLMCSLPRFFSILDRRAFGEPYEPLLGHLPATDVSLVIFVLLYFSFGLAFLNIYRMPVLMLRGLQAMFIMLVLRMATMFFLPLGPPPELISLKDPILQIFYPTSHPFEKDLFFSGHTANAFLFYLVMPVRKWRWVLLCTTFLIGSLVLVQHVHWTIDVLAAPFFAALAWRLSRVTVGWSLATVTAPSVVEQELPAG